MKALFLALFVAVSSTVFGNDEPAMTVVSFKGSEVFKVIYKGTTTGKVRLNILDAKGRTLHSEVISGVDGFILPVNFKGLTSGKYTIELVDNFGKYEQEVVYKPFVDAKSIHVSKILSEEGKFLLAVANAKNEAIRVKIYDDTQRLLYNESKILSGDFAQVFRIQNPQTNYTFEISDEAGNSKYFNF